MELELYQIDAFASHVFEGNPAAVCPLKEWLPDSVMQSIAAENNLSETAFFVPVDRGYHIRWFTPVREVKLCGHATLASAFVLYEYLHCKDERIDFISQSGRLSVQKKKDMLEMDFPVQKPEICELPDEIKGVFKKLPVACLKSEDYILVYDNEEIVHDAEPDMSLLKSVGLRGVIITAKARDYDFVVRFFAPKYGIDEDPVTGSAFTQLVPYWAEKMNRNKFSAKQVSSRGGEVMCELRNERVIISGKAVCYMQARINV